MRNLIVRLLDLIFDTRDLNCLECGKLCHAHEPSCSVPPGEIGEEE